MVLLPQIIQQFASREFALFLCTLTSCRRQNVRNERSAGWPIRCLGRAFYGPPQIGSFPECRYWPTFMDIARSEEHTSELQSLMRISYAVFCLTQTNTSAKVYVPEVYHEYMTT